MIKMYEHFPTLGENMLRNPSAEQAPTKAYDWFTYYSPTIARDTTQSHSGTASVKFTTTATSGQGCMCGQQRIVGAGRFQGRCWINGPAGMTIQAGYRFYWQGTFTDSYRTKFVLTGGWQQIVFQVYAVSNNAKPVFLVLLLHTDTPYPAIGTEFWVDDVEIKPVP